MAAEVKKKLEQSFATIREYFSPSRRQEVCGNIVQLVLFAEHAAKVSLSELFNSTSPINFIVQMVW